MIVLDTLTLLGVAALVAERVYVWRRARKLAPEPIKPPADPQIVDPPKIPQPEAGNAQCASCHKEVARWQWVVFPDLGNRPVCMNCLTEKR